MHQILYSSKFAMTQISHLFVEDSYNYYLYNHLFNPVYCKFDLFHLPGKNRFVTFHKIDMQ